MALSQQFLSNAVGNAQGNLPHCATGAAKRRAYGAACGNASRYRRALSDCFGSHRLPNGSAYANPGA